MPLTVRIEIGTRCWMTAAGLKRDAHVFELAHFGPSIWSRTATYGCRARQASRYREGPERAACGSKPRRTQRIVT
jgi:hypothetical protein